MLPNHLPTFFSHVNEHKSGKTGGHLGRRKRLFPRSNSGALEALEEVATALRSAGFLGDGDFGVQTPVVVVAEWLGIASTN